MYGIIENRTVGKDVEMAGMPRNIGSWVWKHPRQSLGWVLGLLSLVGIYLGLGVAVELPAVVNAAAKEEATSFSTRPHIEKCVVGVEAGISKAKAEEALKCAAAVVEIHGLGLRAMATLEDNPLIVIKAHALYQGSREWREVLELGDKRTAPVLAKCFEGKGDPLFDANSSFAKSARGFFEGKTPSFERLSPEQCGWYAVQLISQTGTDFLSQFAVKDGVAYRLPLRTAGAFMLRSIAGATLDVEKKLVLKEEIPSSQWAWAAVEVGTLGFLTTKLVLAKAIVAGVGAKAVGTGLVAGALKVGAVAVAPVVKFAAVGGLAYYAVTNTGDMTKKLGSVANFFGISPLAFQIVWWVGFIVLVATFLYWLAKPVRLVLAIRRAHQARTRLKFSTFL